MDLIPKVLWMPLHGMRTLKWEYLQISTGRTPAGSREHVPSQPFVIPVFSFPFSLLPLSVTRSLPRNHAACATLKSVLLHEAFYLLCERGYLAHPQHAQHIAVPPWEGDRLLEIFLFIAFQWHAVPPSGQMDSHNFLLTCVLTLFSHLTLWLFFPQLQ